MWKFENYLWKFSKTRNWIRNTCLRELVFHTPCQFLVLPNFHSCFYYCMETREMFSFFFNHNYIDLIERRYRLAVVRVPFLDIATSSDKFQATNFRNSSDQLETFIVMTKFSFELFLLRKISELKWTTSTNEEMYLGLRYARRWLWVIQTIQQVRVGKPLWEIPSPGTI